MSTSMNLSGNILSAINVPEGTERLDLSGNGLRSLKELKLPSTLKTLNLICNDIRKIGEGVFPEGLEALYLSKNFNLKQGEIVPNIMTLSNLTHLALTGIFMSYENFACIRSLQHLKSLHSPIITGKVSRGYLHTFKEDIEFPENLEFLTMRYCPKIKSWGQLILPGKLKSIWIENDSGNNRFEYKKVEVQTLPLLHFPEGVEEIHIKSYDLVTVIEDIQFPQSLRSLDLGGNDLGDGRVLSSLPDLEDLDLGFCKIESLEYLNMPSLMKLDLTLVGRLTNISNFQIPDGLKYTFNNCVKSSASHTRRRNKSGIIVDNKTAVGITFRNYLFGKVWHAPITWKEDDVNSEYNRRCSLAFFEKEFMKAMVNRDVYLEELERENWELFR